MHPIKVLILVALTFIGSYYRSYVSHKETGQRLFDEFCEMEQRIIPEGIEDGVPIYSSNGYAQIRIIHNCQQIIYEEFKLWK